MKRLLILALAVLAVSRSSAAQGPGTPSPDEAAIRGVVRNYVNARELREPAALEALFTADADQHTTAGEWRRGRTQVAGGSLASSTQNPGDRTITIETVRFITPDVAIADGPYVITTGATVRRMWTTIVLEREDGAWRITAIRNMLPAGSAAPAR
jgi:uncharacterized protein (TIGR02246 family)